MSEQRLENLETVVRALRNEVKQLRDEVVRLGENGAVGVNGVGASPPRLASPNEEAARVGSPAGSAWAAPGGTITTSGPGAASASIPSADPIRRPPAAGGPPPDSQDTANPRGTRHPSTAPRAVSTRKQIDDLGLEAMVGRYGTLAVAAVLVVMGVGAFVTWAATRIVIGPTARVALGALAALALAVLGRRLARRGSVAFGSTILALALAVAHVDAWAAGPVLHVVPNLVALGAAALASVALAALALRERNETLFAVGVGGALLAPFVTGDQQSSVILLLSYGWVVVASALAAARPREWILTTGLVAIGAMLYTSVAVDGTTTGLAEQVAVAAFPLACAWAAYLWGANRQRSALSLGFVALGAVALLILTVRDPILAFTALPVLGTTSAYVMVELRGSSRSQIVAGALVLPLAFLLCALAAVDFDQQRGALLAAVWATAAAALAMVSHGRREMHLTAASFAVLAAIVLALYDRPVECVIALSAATIGIAYLTARLDARTALLPFLAALMIAAFWSHVLLAGREAFAYPPFLTRESLAAAAVVAAAYAGWRLIRDLPDQVGQAAALASGALVFLWIRAELEHAVAPQVATFSLILYYAAVGIMMIFAGRQRGIGKMRIAGLALALYAAAKAVMQASGLTMIGLRVGSYLLVGGFLLAVAYWYRAGSARPADQSAERA